MTKIRVGRRRLLMSAVFIVVLGAVVLWRAVDVENEAGEIVAGPVDVGTPIPPEARLSPDEQAYYDFVAPRLLRLAAETNRLAELGRERSRNVLELQVRATRVERAAAEIETYFAQNAPPSIFVAATDLCRSGIATVRLGMTDARSAMARFDWDGVAAGLDRFASGSSELELASATLAKAAGATPVVPMTPDAVTGMSRGIGANTLAARW